jgi:hypothetical protein
MAADNTLMVVASYNPIYHLYVTIKDPSASFIGVNYPPYITVNYPNRPPIRINYIVRDSIPHMFENTLAIHGAPRGCKAYFKPAYEHIKKRDPTASIRLCTCYNDKVAADQRKAARMERQSKGPRPTMAQFLGLSEV